MDRLRNIIGAVRQRVEQALCRRLGNLEQALTPVNWLLATLLPPRPYPQSVLHVSYMVHTPRDAVQVLRQHGMRADYLAIGRNWHWNRSDYVFDPSPDPCMRSLQEFWMFWRVVARYETIHAHFMYTLSETGWELRWLKKMGRTLVAHFRGCEARDRERNMTLHPEVNICQTCDYHASICRSPISLTRRRLAAQYGDVILVSTPDLRDFVPNGIHVPFFAPFDLPAPPERSLSRWPDKTVFKIVHATVHPGIEGTAQIQAAVRRLQDKGWPVQFEFLHLVERDKVWDALRDADLAVGKMKMGYYANFPIEAMASGVPTMTYVRDEFMTDELRDSGFILATLPTLEATIEYYLRHPDKLAEKRAKARRSILALHDNDRLARQLIALYGRTADGRAGRAMESAVGAIPC
jgi:glycosyltransferase involved in cell wall biosynthesis